MNNRGTLSVWKIVGNTCIACTAIAGAAVLFHHGNHTAGGFVLAFPLVFHFQ